MRTIHRLRFTPHTHDGNEPKHSRRLLDQTRRKYDFFPNKYIKSVWDYGTESGRAVLVDVTGGQEVATAVHPLRRRGDRLCICRATTSSCLSILPLQIPRITSDALVATILRCCGRVMRAEDVIGIGTDHRLHNVAADGSALCGDRPGDNSYSWVKLWKHHAQPEPTGST